MEKERRLTGAIITHSPSTPSVVPGRPNVTSPSLSASRCTRVAKRGARVVGAPAYSMAQKRPCPRMSETCTPGPAEKGASPLRLHNE